MARRLLVVAVMACALAVAQQTPGPSKPANRETKSTMAPTQPQAQRAKRSGVVDGESGATVPSDPGEPRADRAKRSSSSISARSIRGRSSGEMRSTGAWPFSPSSRSAIRTSGCAHSRLA